MSLRERNGEKLPASLNEDEKETSEKFNGAQAELDDLLRYDKFSVGFKLGVMLMVGTFMGKEELET